jgi:hypothetical protein
VTAANRRPANRPGEGGGYTLPDMDLTGAADATSQLRRELAPNPDDPAAVETTCTACGETFWRWKRRPRRYCPTCARNRQIQGTAGIQAREGPAYERSVLRALEHYTAEANRLGLTPGGRPSDSDG